MACVQDVEGKVNPNVGSATCAACSGVGKNSSARRSAQTVLQGSTAPPLPNTRIACPSGTYTEGAAGHMLCVRRARSGESLRVVSPGNGEQCVHSEQCSGAPLAPRWQPGGLAGHVWRVGMLAIHAPSAGRHCVCGSILHGPDRSCRVLLSPSWAAPSRCRLGRSVHVPARSVLTVSDVC